MAAIHRRSQRAPISREFTLATKDDLDGTADNSQAVDVTGADRILIFQIPDGTAGTAGIDVVEISHDGGTTWAPAEDVLALDSDDKSGTVLTGGALNAAGVEPTTTAVFKCGPYAGPTALRISRDGNTGSGTAWVTGAPTVKCVLVGGNTGGQPSALSS